MNTNQQDFIELCSSVLSKFRMSEDVRLFIVSQFCLESNFGLSSKSVYCSNCSGMRYPFIRLTVAVGSDDDGFAVYDSIFDCIIDYVICLTNHGPSSDVWQDVEMFKFFIKNWYCPDWDYLDKITKIFNQLKSQNHE